MAILKFDESTQGYALRSTQGTFTVGFKFCLSPLCACPRVTFLCRRLGTDGEPTVDREPQISFTLDVVKRRVADRKELKRQLLVLELAQEVVIGMGDEEWRELYGLLAQEKRKQFRETDPLTWDVQFPSELMGDNIPLVRFAEIFRFEDRFFFECGPDQWLADDRYCTNPDCRCREVLLTFIRIPVASSFGKRIKEMFLRLIRFFKGKEMPSVFYDYDTGVIKTDGMSVEGRSSLETLFAALKRSRPNFGGELQQRHDLLKVLHRRARETEGVDETSQTTSLLRVGRNDPCPCGSGKKFKRCCALKRDRIMEV